MNASTLIVCSKNAYLSICLVRHYAVKAANPAIAGLGKKVKSSKAEVTKIKLDVETDTHKLVNYVCGSNLLQNGEDIKLKPDNEYPDWLWSINTGPRKKLEDLEPGSKEYLELLKKINISKALRLKSLSKIKQQ